jgi:transposase-like protein
MKKPERENWQKEMFSLIRKWKESGINQKDFCRQHDLTLHAFYYWLRKYKQINVLSENGFLPVELRPPVSDTREDIQIRYPNGVLVILDKSISISRIRALIKAI